MPVFWRKPQPYAKFLSQELLGPAPYTNRVLVVMPNGFGLSHNGKPLPAERRALDSVAPAEDRDEDIAAAGFRAVQELAALHGVHVSGSVPRTGDRDRLPVVWRGARRPRSGGGVRGDRASRAPADARHAREISCDPGRDQLVQSRSPPEFAQSQRRLAHANFVGNVNLLSGSASDTQRNASRCLCHCCAKVAASLAQ